MLSYCNFSFFVKSGFRILEQLTTSLGYYFLHMPTSASYMLPLSMDIFLGLELGFWCHFLSFISFILYISRMQIFFTAPGVTVLFRCFGSCGMVPMADIQCRVTLVKKKKLFSMFKSPGFIIESRRKTCGGGVE